MFYVAYGGGLYAAQTQMLFPVPSTSPGELTAAAAADHADEVTLTADDGIRSYAWHRAAGGRRLVVYAHGNAETCANRTELYDHLAGLGWDTLAVEYRGYPGSEGAPSEAGIHADMRAAWRYATVDLGVPADHVVLHGFSLGGGAIGTLLDEVAPGAVVLESTFTSVWDLARPRAPIWPLSLLLKNPFLTMDRARTLHAPVLVIHGTADTVIPVEQGRRLAAAIPTATYLELPGVGHQPSILPGTPTMAAYDALLAGVAGP